MRGGAPKWQGVFVKRVGQPASSRVSKKTLGRRKVSSIRLHRKQTSANLPVFYLARPPQGMLWLFQRWSTLYLLRLYCLQKDARSLTTLPAPKVLRTRLSVYPVHEIMRPLCKVRILITTLIPALLRASKLLNSFFCANNAVLEEQQSWFNSYEGTC